MTNVIELMPEAQMVVLKNNQKIAKIVRGIEEDVGNISKDLVRSKLINYIANLSNQCNCKKENYSLNHSKYLIYEKLQKYEPEKITITPDFSVIMDFKLFEIIITINPQFNEISWKITQQCYELLCSLE